MKKHIQKSIQLLAIRSILISILLSGGFSVLQAEPQQCLTFCEDYPAYVNVIDLDNNTHILKYKDQIINETFVVIK